MSTSRFQCNPRFPKYQPINPMSVPANAATSSNSSTPSQADDTMKTPTTLESIPIELRRQIYTHLLKADHVRQLPNKFLICSYRFETAILSVNKKIHQQASDILYNENQFVTISCDWDIILTVMSNHEVAIVCGEPNLVGRFKKNIMRLHIKFPWACYKPESSGLGSKKKTGKVLESFIILADDVPSFTRMLHIMNMTNGGEMQVTKYLFRIEPTSTGPPSLNLQKNLLEPFRYLYTKEGTCSPRVASNLLVPSRVLQSIPPEIGQYCLFPTNSVSCKVQ